MIATLGALIQPSRQQFKNASCVCVCYILLNIMSCISCVLFLTDDCNFLPLYNNVVCVVRVKLVPLNTMYVVKHGKCIHLIGVSTHLYLLRKSL